MQYSEIEYRMYQETKAVKEKGLRKRLSEWFLWKDEKHAYIVAILQKAPLIGEGKSSFSYVLFDIATEKTVDEESQEYKTMVGKMPGLEALIVTGGTLDFMQERKLRSEMRAIAEEFSESGEIPARYKETAGALAAMMSESLKEIYRFFTK